ncbi:phage portal protein [Ottowia sp. GY511]|uniref:Phage portal protein n=1 Tax=Ottowia flava TaxID=2675430 RepID=A0ABW4KU71_9BURK|nr:phage portal protein [Ottowia sp. GY511]TXK26502.1 phage portal protein [Ottowia sp. GY511]
MPGNYLNTLKSQAVLDAARSGISATVDGPAYTLPGMGQGATPARRTWWPRAHDARTDTLPELTFNRAASRELIRTNAIAAGAIQTNLDRVVGTGLALVAQPNRQVLGWSADQAAEWKAKTQAEFSLWSDSTDCDQEGTQNFYEKQALTLGGALASGDCFTLMPNGQRTSSQPYALRLQTIEADRVGPTSLIEQMTATEAGGVRFDPRTGVPTDYHLYDVHPGAWMAGAGLSHQGRWVKRIGASGRRVMLHHFQKKRPGMVRGVPYLTPIIDCIKQIGRYSDAEIMAAVISAYLTVFIKTPGGDASPAFAGEEVVVPTEGEIGLGMGAVVGLAPGEEPVTVNPSRPNPQFAPFIEGVMTQIGMALGIPREVLIKQFNSSYSASKAALLDAWVYFRGMRYWLAGSFCQPIYETWLAEAVSLGRIAAPGFFTDPLLRWAYTRASWPGDSMGSINPKDEVEAYTRAIDARLMTRELAEWQLFGTDFNQTFDQKADEIKRLAAADMLPAAAPGAAAQPQPSGAPTKEPTE